MIYPILTPEEAAEFVQHGMNVGVSGFTAPGCPKVVPPAIAAKAKREHEAGREFKINLYTGASTNDYTDGELSRVDALNFRTPYQSLGDLRKHINAGDVHYNDRHLSELSQEFRHGYYGKMDIAIGGQHPHLAPVRREGHHRDQRHAPREHPRHARHLRAARSAPAPRDPNL